MAEDNTAEDPLLGQTLAGFVLRERLGEGASATVYRGESTTHASIIRAIKVVHEDKQRKIKLKDRFVEEARLLAKLVHPNIVTFYHATNDLGRLVMVLEFLEGATLRAHLNSWRASVEFPPLDTVLEILCQASDGVAFAHGGGSSVGVAGVSNTQRMAGNVWEWTDSFYTTNYKSKSNNKSELRVLRGGGWNNVNASGVRASVRDRYAPTNRNSDLGFRCAKTVNILGQSARTSRIGMLHTDIPSVMIHSPNPMRPGFLAKPDSTAYAGRQPRPCRVASAFL